MATQYVFRGGFFAGIEGYILSFAEEPYDLELIPFIDCNPTGAGFLPGAAVSSGAKEIWHTYAITIFFRGVYGLAGMVLSALVRHTISGTYEVKIPEISLAPFRQFSNVVALFLLSQKVYKKVEQQDSIIPRLGREAKR